MKKPYVVHDKKFKFKEVFDPETGFYARTNVLDENGNETEEEPFMRSFPGLIDVGVMGRCVHGQSGLCQKAGIQCYQDAPHSKKHNMPLSDYKRIVDECKKYHTNQLALGGAGDVDQHEDFEEILRYTRASGIIPNFTTSGLGLTPEKAAICKKYCGAVAVSQYSRLVPDGDGFKESNDYTNTALKNLIDVGVTTNIHFVLGKNTIDEAIYRLKNNKFYPGINAVIFLLHKPVGLGTKENMLTVDDPRLAEFFALIDDAKKLNFKVGFDSCSIPGILNFTKNIALESIDTCEGGRFSMYISADMIAMPCSFDNQKLRWGVDIKNASIMSAWTSEKFEDFRNHMRKACPGCSKRCSCMGGCPIVPEIVLCKNKH